MMFGSAKSYDPKLISREIRIQTYVITIFQRTDRQTDGRTDVRTDDLPWQYRALRSITR